MILNNFVFVTNTPN